MVPNDDLKNLIVHSVAERPPSKETYARGAVVITFGVEPDGVEPNSTFEAYANVFGAMTPREFKEYKSAIINKTKYDSPPRAFRITHIGARAMRQLESLVVMGLYSVTKGETFGIKNLEQNDLYRAIMFQWTDDAYRSIHPQCVIAGITAEIRNLLIIPSTVKLAITEVNSDLESSNLKSSGVDNAKEDPSYIFLIVAKHRIVRRPPSGTGNEIGTLYSEYNDALRKMVSKYEPPFHYRHY